MNFKAKFRRFLTVGLIAVGLFLPAVAVHAYEVDTHFYDIYIMSRRAGFNHEYGLFLATVSQWVDEGVSSTPMGGLIYGTMLRRIWHFPNYRFQKQQYSQDGHAGFKSITLAEFDHPVAYKLFDEGLREGNWYKLGLAFHVVADTAGHAGYTAEAGHAEFGHNPDRTWLASEKYKRMTGLLFKMLVALRQIVPDEALDTWALIQRQDPMTDEEYKALQEANWSEVKDLVSLNYFKDPRFTPAVVNYILRLARAKGFLASDFDVDSHLPGSEDYWLSEGERASMVDKGDKWDRTRKDARQVLREWVKFHRQQELATGILVKGSIFNMNVFDYFGWKSLREKLEAFEASNPNIQDRIREHGRLVSPELQEQLIEQTVDFFTRGEIPKDFDDYTRVQFENDSGPRSLEQRLKIGDRREYIYRTYGVNIEFIPHTWIEKLKRKGQAKKEAKIQKLDPSLDLMLPKTEPEVLASKDVEVVSLNRKQQVGVFLVKHGHNLRTAIRDFMDMKPLSYFTKGEWGMARHTDVKGFQILDILNERIARSEYIPLGPLSRMSLVGASKENKPGVVQRLALACKDLLGTRSL